MRSTQEKIRSLAENVFSHSALNNDFYRRWTGGALPLDEVEVFARNYLARTCQHVNHGGLILDRH
ncbi:hypothetical protein GALL_499200 [mine drainage metagenome]|uniref:Uncharacterized protein n=1 Tax=mine drainage metagenome TaxID=410659 RepID=A0A1J5PB04_9ZZZZ